MQTILNDKIPLKQPRKGVKKAKPFTNNELAKNPKHFN